MKAVQDYYEGLSVLFYSHVCTSDDKNILL
jgi:hypothetical protein